MRSTNSGRLNQRGATLVLMAIAVFMTLGMAALAIDYGMIKSAKAEAQRAMDSAALAGASAFLEPDPTVDKEALAIARAHEFAKKHRVRLGPITDAEMTPEVEVDLAKETVKASWARPDLKLWFANVFGTNTMGLVARATAQAVDAGVTQCVKPVAIPDIWNNAPNLVDPPGPTPAGESEDKNGDHLWNYDDKNSNGVWDDGEGEPWQFTPGADTYDPTTIGYGTDYRDALGTGNWAKTQDYGRQMILQTFSPKDAVIESMYRTWGVNSDNTNVDSLSAGIRGTKCSTAAVGTTYTQANGAKIPLQLDWEYVINQDPGATWNNSTNTVNGSTYGSNWLDESPRVVVVGLYDPSVYALTPNSNEISFVNFARVWLDQRPCSGTTGGLGNCKPPITVRFLGYLPGGAGGPTTGPLVKRLVLIK